MLNSRVHSLPSEKLFADTEKAVSQAALLFEDASYQFRNESADDEVGLVWSNAYRFYYHRLNRL